METNHTGTYQKRITVTPSLCDASFSLGIAQRFALLQDIAAEHAEALGVGGAAMTERGAFWLAVHTRVTFFDTADMMAPLTVTTWPVRCAGEDLRLYRLYRIESEGRVLSEGRTEWMILNTKTGRLLRARDAGFPTDMDYCDEQVCVEPFSRVSDTFTEDDVVYRRKAVFSDIDYGAHMNNVAYVRAMLDSFTAEQMRRLRVKSMEIRYHEPCREGDVFAVCRKETETGYVFAIKKPDGKLSATGILTV